MRIFLQEEQTKDEAAQVFEDYSKIRGYDIKEDLMQFAYYGPNSNFKRFAVNVAKLLPKECDLKIEQGGMAISITYKGQEPNIPSSYKSEFNRIKAKFENSMEYLNLHEAVNSKIIFNEILNND